MSDLKNHEASLGNGVESVMAAFSYDPTWPYPESVQRAVHLARLLQERACELQTPQERRQQAELDRMVKSPNDRATLMDSALDEHLEAAGSAGQLSSADGVVSVHGFDHLVAHSTRGGRDTKAVGAIDFILELHGQWA